MQNKNDKKLYTVSSLMHRPEHRLIKITGKCGMPTFFFNIFVPN